MLPVCLTCRVDVALPLIRTRRESNERRAQRACLATHVRPQVLVNGNGEAPVEVEASGMATLVVDAPTPPPRGARRGRRWQKSTSRAREAL